ncbi:MAG: aminoglycoside phosphotransferase family protein [Oscillospiraceae bacterium]|nr:aminoglycoside phosphotransferase family protein [Oscillospiraceae bacterium]
MTVQEDRIITRRPNKIIYREGDTVVKLFNQDYSKASVLNEALNQARVEETDLNIPRIHEIFKTAEGEWAIRSDYIEGKTMQQLMDENPDKRDEYLKQLVELQMLIHTKRAPLLTKLKDKMHRKISSSKFEATVRFELHTRLEGMPNHKKVCHGDFNPSNVIIRPDGTPFIIDWAHATQGNASADVARTYLYLTLNGQEQLAKEYLKLFCKMSDTALQYVQNWMPIVAASQSVKENNPEDFEMLSRWVNVVDYV